MKTREFVTRLIEGSIAGYMCGMTPNQLADIIVDQFGKGYESMFDRNFSDFMFDQLYDKIEKEIIEA